MLSDNEKLYLLKIYENQNKTLRFYALPFFLYVILVFSTGLVFSIIAALRDFDPIYIAGLVICPISIGLFVWMLIRIIRKDMPYVRSGSAIRGYYEDSGVLKRVVIYESDALSTGRVSRWFLNDVSVLWPPYADELKDNPVKGLENGQHVKGARLVLTDSEPLRPYQQAYLLSWDDHYFIDDDYGEYIKPYYFFFNQITIWGPLLFAFVLGTPFYIAWDNPTMQYSLVHYVALVLIIIPLVLTLPLQMRPLFRNMGIKRRYRDSMNS